MQAQEQVCVHVHLCMSMRCCLSLLCDFDWNHVQFVKCQATFVGPVDAMGKSTGRSNKAHSKAKAGAKAKKKESKYKRASNAGAGSRNPKAFTVAAPQSAKKAAIKGAEKEQRRLSAPLLQPEAARSAAEGSLEDPPLVVAVQGPSQV